MPLFEYVALNDEEGCVRGFEAGPTPEHVKGALSERGLLVSQIWPAQVPGDPIAEPERLPGLAFRRNTLDLGTYEADPASPRVGNIPLWEIYIVLRQIAAMLKSGMNPVLALEQLRATLQNAKLRRIVEAARDNANVGGSIVDEFRKHPEVFSSMVVTLMGMGEAAGNLDSRLFLLSDFLVKDIELRQHIRQETFAAKLCAFGTLYAALGLAGWSGLLLMGTASYAWTGTVVAAVVSLLSVAYFRILLPRARVRYWHDSVLVMLPLFGGSVRDFACARFARALATLYAGGIPLSAGTEMAAEACGNACLREKLARGAGRLRTGSGLGAVIGACGVYRGVDACAFDTAEKTGNVDGMLIRLADTLEDEAQVQAKKATTWFALGCLALVCMEMMLMLYLALGRR